MAKFKSDRQRKAVMAKMARKTTSAFPQLVNVGQQKQVPKKGVISRLMDKARQEDTIKGLRKELSQRKEQEKNITEIRQLKREIEATTPRGKLKKRAGVLFKQLIKKVG